MAVTSVIKPVPFGGTPVLGCRCLACSNARKVEARARRDERLHAGRFKYVLMAAAGVWLVIAGIALVVTAHMQ